MKPLSNLQVLIDRIPFAEGNLGEEAILATLLQDLRACGIKDMTIFSNLPERTRRRHGDTVRVIPDKIWRWPLLPFQVSQADVLIWGGGHMLQDRSSRLYIPYVTRVLLLARFFRIPRLIYAPGLGPVTTRLGKILSRWALRRCRMLTTRDNASIALLKSLGLTDAFLPTADPAFSLTTPYDELRRQPTERGPVIGFAPRRHFYRRGSWLPMSWQMAASQSNPKFEHFLQESAAALDYLVEKRGARIQLLAMDVGPNPRDDLICHRLRNYMVHPEAAHVCDDDPPLEEFVRRLSELDLLISARLHGVILGLRFGLPFIGIDSDGKIASLGQGLGLGNWVIEDVDLNRERLCELAVSILDQSEKLRQNLARQGIVFRDRARQNRAELRRCLREIAERE